jgi:hypothetical protein
MSTVRSEPIWLRWSRWVDRAYGLFNVVREEVALSRIHSDQMQAILAERYGQNRHVYADPAYIARGLYDWEAAAVARFFPPPPARILVGATGCGRELFALAALGYRVDGMEPSPALFEGLLAENARRQLDPPPVLMMAGYDELAQGRAPEIEACAPYDAVVLGWASLSHVSSAETRRRLLPTLARLCPGGPVLISFSPASGHTFGGRAEKVRGSVRRALSWLPGSQDVAAGDAFSGYGNKHSYFSGYGYEHCYSQAELDQLTGEAGYTQAFSSLGGPDYPHAVLTRQRP